MLSGTCFAPNLRMIAADFWDSLFQSKEIPFFLHWRTITLQCFVGLLQYSCLENPMDRGSSQATVHGVTESWTQLSDWSCMHTPLLVARQLLTGSDPAESVSWGWRWGLKPLPLGLTGCSSPWCSLISLGEMRDVTRTQNKNAQCFTDIWWQPPGSFPLTHRVSIPLIRILAPVLVLLALLLATGLAALGNYMFQRREKGEPCGREGWRALSQGSPWDPQCPHDPRETLWGSVCASQTWVSGALLLFSEGPTGQSTSNSNGEARHWGALILLWSVWSSSSATSLPVDPMNPSMSSLCRFWPRVRTDYRVECGPEHLNRMYLEALHLLLCL